MPSLASGKASWTACASTCAAECRSTARPSGESALTVDLAEPLGMESLIYTRLAGQEVQAKLYGPRIVAPGEVLTFRLALVAKPERRAS